MNAANLLQLAKLKARFDKMTGRADAAAQAALESSADDLVAEMQRMAPRNTGRLAASIVATPAGHDTPENALGETQTMPEGHIAVTAGNREVFYAPMVEFGTSHAHAQPFFMPAYRASKGKIAGAVKAAVNVAVKASS